MPDATVVQIQQYLTLIQMGHLLEASLQLAILNTSKKKVITLMDQANLIALAAITGMA